MNILWLHHFEDDWNYSMKEFNTNYEKELIKILNYLENENIDKVLVTRFLKNKSGDCHEFLIAFCQIKGIQIEFKEYGYGFRNDDNQYKKKDFGKSWIYGNRSGHDENDILIIEDFQRELKNHTIFLGGAFENECLNDVETVMNHLNINYTKIPELCVGTYADYSFFNTPNEKVMNFLNSNGIFEEDIQEEFQKDPITVLEKEKKLNEFLKDTDRTLFFSLELSYQNEQLNISDSTYEYIKDLIENNIELADSNIPEEYILKIIDDIYEEYTLSDYEDIEDLIFDDPELYKNIISHMKELIPNFIENFNELSNNQITITDIKDISNSDIFNELLDHIEKNQDLVINILKRKKTSALEGTYYHGTFFNIESIADIEENSFFELDLENTNLNANYITDEIIDAEDFIDYHRNKNEGIGVVFEFNLNINNIYKLDNSKKDIVLSGQTYSVVDDRMEYFEQLRMKNFNGCLLENNYNNGGHDIALFQNITPEKVKFQINDEWTDFMDIDLAVDFLENTFKNKRKKKLIVK